MVWAERPTKLVITQPAPPEGVANTAARAAGLDFLIVATQQGGCWLQQWRAGKCPPARTQASFGRLPSVSPTPLSSVFRQTFRPVSKEVIGNSGDAVLINAAGPFSAG